MKLQKNHTKENLDLKPENYQINLNEMRINHCFTGFLKAAI
jgi:hypothetical protein